MKKILLASALVLAIAVSAAVAQEVLSQNAVGYIKVNLPANKFVSVAQPLNNMGKAENKFGETSIAQELPRSLCILLGPKPRLERRKGAKGWQAAIQPRHRGWRRLFHQVPPGWRSDHYRRSAG